MGRLRRAQLIAALEEARRISKTREDQRAGLLHRRHAASPSALAVLEKKGRDFAQSLTLLTTLLDFTEVGDIRVYIDENFVEKREKQLEKGGLVPGQELAGRVLEPARQRPGVELRGQQLPEGQAAARVRPALLERRRDQPARARCTRTTCATPTRTTSSAKPDALKMLGTPVSLKRIKLPDVRLLRARGPHRAVEGRLRQRAHAGRQGDVRARRERAHRGNDQSGVEEQAQLLDEWRAPGRSRSNGSRRRDGSARKLVDRMVEVAEAPRRADGRRAQEPGRRQGTGRSSPRRDAT